MPQTNQIQKSKQQEILASQVFSVIPSHETELKIVFLLQCGSDGGVGIAVCKMQCNKKLPSTSHSLSRALQD